MTDDVRLRDVMPDDLRAFFEHQRDPEAVRMAAFPSRERDAFMAHWAKILGDGTVVVRTILYRGEVAGNIGSWVAGSERLVGYWLGRQYWGKGIASRALAQFVQLVAERPLRARVWKENLASKRVLEKCGFTEVGSDGAEELIVELA